MQGLIWLGAGYVLSQFYRAFLAVLTPSLAADLGATKADLALASGMWFFTFALMQFAVGVGLDRVGPRRTAGALLAVAGAGGIGLFAIALAPWVITVAMGLIGIGCAPLLMASLYIFARTQAPARFATLVSVFIGIGTLGNVAAAAPLALAGDMIGWRAVAGVLCVVTLVVAAGITTQVRDPETVRDGDDDGGLSGYFKLLSMPVLWLIFPVMIVNYSAAAGIRGLWAGPMLADIHAAEATLIGNVTLVMALSMAVGSFIYGPLDTLFNTRKWVAFGGMSIGLVAIIAVALQPAMPVLTLAILFAVIGLTGMVYGVIMAHAKGFFPDTLTGRGITLMNFFSIGGVSVIQIASGRVVTAAAAGADPAGPAAYAALFWFYAVLFVVTLAIYLFSRDSKPRAN